MSTRILVWGVYHKGNGGFNSNFLGFDNTPVDVEESTSDLRESNIIEEDNSRFYSISLTSNHRIYTIHTFSLDHQGRSGFTAISIYTERNVVLINIFESLNSSLNLYLDKKDAIYDKMFEPILNSIEPLSNYNDDEDKSSGASCFYGTGENSINYFLNNSNTQNYKKVYVTHNNNKIKEKYTAYLKDKGRQPQPSTIPLQTKRPDKSTILLISGFVFLIIMMAWFITSLFSNTNDTNEETATIEKIEKTNEKIVLKKTTKEIADIDFDGYKIQFIVSGEEQIYYWQRNGGKIQEITKQIILIRENRDRLREFPNELTFLKSNIQEELISDNGVEILLYNKKDNLVLPENIERIKELELTDKLIKKQIRYKNGSFEIDNKNKWVRPSNSSLYVKIFQFYLEGINEIVDGENVVIEDPKGTEKSIVDTNVKVKKPRAPDKICTKHSNVDVKILEDNLDPDEIEKSTNKLNEEIKKLDRSGNCPSCQKKLSKLKGLKSELTD